MDSIHEQIEFYHRESANMSGDTLQTLFDRLSSNLFFFMGEFEKSQKDFIEKYSTYRKARSEIWLQTKYGRTEKVTDNQAEKETDGKTSKEFADRLFAEADLDLKKERINAVKQVLKAVESRLDSLRAEKYLSRKQ